MLVGFLQHLGLAAAPEHMGGVTADGPVVQHLRLLFNPKLTLLQKHGTKKAKPLTA